MSNYQRVSMDDWGYPHDLGNLDFGWSSPCRKLGERLRRLLVPCKVWRADAEPGRSDLWNMAFWKIPVLEMEVCSWKISYKWWINGKILYKWRFTMVCYGLIYFNILIITINHSYPLVMKRGSLGNTELNGGVLLGKSARNEGFSSKPCLLLAKSTL